MLPGVLLLSAIMIFIMLFLPLWAATVMGILMLLTLIGDIQGKAKYGDRYRFEDGVDR